MANRASGSSEEHDLPASRHGPSEATPTPSPVTLTPRHPVTREAPSHPDTLVHPVTLDVGELLLALGVIALGAVIVWQTTLIRLTPAYAKVGPRVIPFIVGGGLIVLGVLLTVAALTGRATTGTGESEDADPTLPTDWRTVGLLALALVAYLVLIEPAGFVIASAVLFAGAAFAMGSRRLLRDIAIGVILALVLYIGFSRGLGLRLPAGVLAGIL